MSTPVTVDPESSTQADGAKSSRVPYHFLWIPMRAISTHHHTLPESALGRFGSHSSKGPYIWLCVFHLRCHQASLPVWQRWQLCLSLHSVRGLGPLTRVRRLCHRLTFLHGSVIRDEGPTAKDEDPAAGDEGLTTGVEGPGMDDESYGLDDGSHGMDDESRGLDDEGHSVESDGLGLGEEEVVPKGQQQAVPVMGTTVSTPLGLGYGALRHRELALEEEHVYSTFEVGQDPEDGMVYIDVPAYPPPPHVQIPPSPEWTSGSLPISPSPSIIPSPISSPMIPLTVPSPVATPATAKTEGFLTELGAQVEI
ncbi:hypothetical protein Tco_0155740 [Tanacetum coccineum]